MVVRNIACSGRFSSDRAVREYAERIWRLQPAGVDLLPLWNMSGSPAIPRYPLMS
jgi:hypothetical protein